MSLSDRLSQARKGRESEVARVEEPRKPTTRSTRKRSVDQYGPIKKSVHAALVESLGPQLYRTQLNEQELNQRVRVVLHEVLARDETPMPAAERANLAQQIADEILGYGPLEPFLRDSDVTEVMVNGFDTIYIERAGKIEQVDAAFSDDAHLRRTIDKIVGRVGRRVDESSPMVDARLPDGSRVNAIVPPLAVDGSALTIRKFATDPYTVDDLIAFGTMTKEVAEFLDACVRGKANILVAGGTGAGKTTTLNVLSSFIPEVERIVTIEDAAELQLNQDHVIRLESRPSNIEGRGEVTIRDLVKNSLRMRPDRIVVGEVRDAAALDMLQAMNTGHDGSICTVHANTPRDTLARIETMVLMAGVDLPGPGDPRAGLQRDRPRRPAGPVEGRLPSHHAPHRGRGHGGRHHHHAGHLPLRLRRGLRRRRTPSGQAGHDRAAAEVPRQAGPERRARRYECLLLRRDVTMGARRMKSVAVLAATATLGLGVGMAAAAPEGRIQQVESVDGTVTYVLSADGLAEGETIDPASVRTTLGGIEAPTTASPVAAAEGPVVDRTTMIVLDSSGSMADFGKLDLAKDAARQYVAALPEDVAGRTDHLLRHRRGDGGPHRGSSSNPAGIDALEARGATALNDAVVVTVDALGTEGSRNIVILSDGNDAGSETSAKKAANDARCVRCGPRCGLAGDRQARGPAGQARRQPATGAWSPRLTQPNSRQRSSLRPAVS